MADFHQIHTLTAAVKQDIIWEIYQFLIDVSQTELQLVVENGITAVYIDTSETDKDLNEPHKGTLRTHAGLTTVQVHLDYDASPIADAYYNATTASTMRINDPGGLHDGETRLTTTTYNVTTKVLSVASAWGTPTLAGTHTIDGTVNVVGTTTAYLTELSVGDSITINAETKEVATITTNTALTVTAAFAGSTTLTGTLNNPRGGVPYQIYNTAGSFATPTIADAFGVGSFLVFEPSFPNPAWSVVGVAQAGTSSTITLAVSSLLRDDDYNGAQIEITSGTGVGQTRICSDYVNSTNIASVSVVWTTTPDTTSVYEITRRWQCLIRRGMTAATSVDNTYLTYEPSPRGGFLIGGNTLGDGEAGWVGGVPTVNYPVNFIDNFTPAAGDSLYMSSVSSDTWNGGAYKYAYFRCIIHDSSAGYAGRGIYAGGYIPFDAEDTDPFVVLGGLVEINKATIADGWGTSDNNTANDNRAPLENGTATSDLSTAYAFAASQDRISLSDDSTTRAGAEVSCPIYVVSLPGQHALGYFGENTMVSVSTTVPHLTVNTAATRIVIRNAGDGGVAIQWQP